MRLLYIAFRYYTEFKLLNHLFLLSTSLLIVKMDLKSRWNMKPLDPSKLNIISRTLHQPPLDELINGNYKIIYILWTVIIKLWLEITSFFYCTILVLTGGLTANFAEASVELADYNADYSKLSYYDFHQKKNNTRNHF